jgi:N-acetyl-anhydromuramyl-L-alanine amidase AmpD
MLLFVTTALAFDVRQVPIAGDARTSPIAEVVVHATGGPSCNPKSSFKGGTLDGIVEYFRTRTDGISIHYVIGETGAVVAMVPEDRVASHASGHNRGSIGIELINDGDGADPFPAAQVEALTALVADILARHHLGTDAVTTHEAVETRYFECVTGPDGSAVPEFNTDGRGQKKNVDPGAAFPWAAFQADLAARVR